MAKDRSRKTALKRPENTREERKGIQIRELLTFSFKDMDETQPSNSPNLLKPGEMMGCLQIYLNGSKNCLN